MKLKLNYRTQQPQKCRTPGSRDLLNQSYLQIIQPYRVFFLFFQTQNNACGPADSFEKAMVKRVNKNHYLANPNEKSVNSHGSIGHSLINTDYHRNANHRGYSTDGKLSC